MGKPVIHWEIGGNDTKMLQDFYSKLFDWKVDSNNPMNYGLANTGGEGGINGGIGPTGEDKKPYVTFYVQVDDLQGYLNRAEKLGGKVVVPPTEIPNIVTFALFTDPEGNRIGLVKG
ncbi:MAG: VOC family protein [Bacteroidota bacterium]